MSRETPTEQLKKAAIEAVLRALGDGQSKPKDKPALTGVRAVAAGAVLYTAGWAVFKGRSVLREQLPANRATPPAKREPVRRAASSNRPRPSLDLPQQRWPRMAADRNDARR